MITILEGPDGAGKTTLGHDGVCFSDHAYVHLGPPSQLGAFHDVVGAITARRRKRHVLFDRLHLGEGIYGPVFRGKDTLGMARRRLIERVLLSRQAVVVLCLPDVERCVETFRARKGEEMLDNEMQLRLVHEAYRTIETHLPIVTYDYTRDMDLLAIDGLRSLIEAARPHFNGGPGVGHFRPGNTLIVGEQVNARAPMPFIDDRGCAIWLAEKLNEAMVPESDLYWINALDPDGEWTDPGFLDGLRPTRIIALGQVAERWCKDVGAGTSTHAIPHPQQHKRFRYHQPYPLTEILAS